VALTLHWFTLAFHAVPHFGRASIRTVTLVTTIRRWRFTARWTYIGISMTQTEQEIFEKYQLVKVGGNGFIISNVNKKIKKAIHEAAIHEAYEAGALDLNAAIRKNKPIPKKQWEIYLERKTAHAIFADMRAYENKDDPPIPTDAQVHISLLADKLQQKYLKRKPLEKVSSKNAKK
jgi:hypothetical protein